MALLEKRLGILDIVVCRSSDIRHGARCRLVLLTKDGDFVRLLERCGPPPRVLWVTCGNPSNRVLADILTRCWPTAVAMLEASEPLVEIAG